MGPSGASRYSKRAKLKPIPPDLYQLAITHGAKPQSIRRYKELYTIGGYNAAMVQIRWENWFRTRWHRRQSLPKELRDSMEMLE